MKGARGKGQGVRKDRLSLIVYCILSIACCLLPDLILAADLSTLKVTSSISPSIIRIGERIDLKVIVEHDKGIDLFYPDESARIAPFEVLKQKITSRKTGSGKNYTEIVYSITTFEAGNFVVPPILITARDRFGNERNVRTIEHKVTVNTGATVGSDIIDIVPPMEVTESRQYLQKALTYLPYILPFLGTIVVIIYLITQRKPEAVIGIDARGRALERLGMLKIDEKEIDRVYFDISEVLRTFFLEHLKIDSVKMTSGELLSSLRKVRNTDKLMDEAEDLFYDLDLVKFSPFSPSVGDAEVAVLRAKRLIRSVP